MTYLVSNEVHKMLDDSIRYVIMIEDTKGFTFICHANIIFLDTCVIELLARQVKDHLEKCNTLNKKGVK